MDEQWIMLIADLMVEEINSHLIALAFGIPSIYDEQTLIREPGKAEFK